MTRANVHYYARENRKDDLQAAIMAGVNLNERDEFGATALHYAIAYKRFDVIALLLQHGADVSVQDNDGGTALHYAVDHNLPEVAEELLKKNPAVIAIVNKHGNEPLWTATVKPNYDYELVSLLLRCGADPNHRNKVNLTPLDVAKDIEDKVLLEMFESKTTSK